MRVLLFRWLCDTGGVSTSMLLLHRELAKRGVECEFWFCKPSNRLGDFQAAGQTTVAPLAALAPRLARGDFDIVHLMTSDHCGPLVSLIAGRARLVVTSRGALADVWNHTNCFAYTAISEGMARINQPYTDLQVELVRNSVALDRFTPPPARTGGRPIVAFVGRTTSPEKDFPRFTRIASRLAERGARLWVADPHEAGWRRFQDLPVAHIELERWERVAHDEMPSFYRAVALSGGAILMTSRSEGFGNVAAEAAACGAITVAPDVLGLNESVLLGRTGTLFAADTSDDAVADLTFEAMAHQPSPAACAEAAQVFSPSVMADAYLAVYQRREQLLVRSRPRFATAPGIEGLLVHLERQRGWRAAEAIRAIGPLAAAGYPGVALKALRLGIQASPSRVFSRSTLSELFPLVARVVRRPARLMRLIRRTEAPPAISPQDP